MAELLLNGFRTTLSGNYTAGSFTASLTSVTGLQTAPYTYTLGVYDQTPDVSGNHLLKVLLRVSALSGTTVTVAAEGSDANAVTGDIVALVTSVQTAKRLSGLELLAEATASSSATLDFTSAITADFDEYEIHVINLVPATNAVNLLIRVSTDGGSTFSTTTYGQTTSFGGNSAADVGNQGDVSGGISLGFSDSHISNSAAGGGVSAIVELFSPGSSSINKAFTWKSVVFSSVSSTYYRIDGSGAWATTTAVNALRLLFSSGNIASGIVRIYGRRKF